MSVGNIVVELELKDGKFTQRMRSAGKTISTFKGSIGGLDKRVRGLEKGLTGMLPRLRDIAIVGASARVIIHSLNETIGAFTGGVIKSSAEIERMNTLLRGMSSAFDTDGQIKEAAKDMGFLFEMAQRAPFSIKELSNSFVKMKSAGIGDVANKVTSLTNAISQFGGDEQTLHRATIAIQQMASKGVVSMEELRQQLGEAVPNAMNLMADGMGMTMSAMVKAISEGRVKAIPAIENMMAEMDKTMSGASERMMGTWNGLMSQFSTRWTLLQKQMGDSGFFQEAKDALSEIVDYLSTDSATQLARDIGVFMRDAVRFTVTAASKIREYSNEILVATKFIVGMYASLKALAIGKTIVNGITAAVIGLRSAMIATGAVSTTVGIAGLIGPTLPIITGIGGVTGAVALLRVGLSALGGPIGIGIGLLTTAAAAWFAYGETGSEALNKLKQNRDDLPEGKTKLEFEVLSLDGLEEAKRSYDDLTKTIADKRGQIEREGRRVSMSLFSTDIDVAMYERWKQRELKVLEELEAEAKIVFKNMSSDQTKVVESESKRRLSIYRRSFGKEMSGFDQHYKDRVGAARKIRDDILASDKTSIEEKKQAEKDFGVALISASKEIYSKRLALVEAEEKKINAKVKSLRAGGIEIATIMDSKAEIDAAHEASVGIQNEIALLRNKIALGKTNGDDIGGLATSLTLLETKLATSELKAKKFQQIIDTLKNGGAVTTEQLIEADKIAEQLDELDESSKKLKGDLKKLEDGDLAAALNKDGDSAKKLTATLQSLKSAVASATDRYEGLKAVNEGAPGTYADKLRSKADRLSESIGGTTTEAKKLIAQLRNLANLNETQDFLKGINTQINAMTKKTENLRVKTGKAIAGNSLIAQIKEGFFTGVIKDVDLYEKMLESAKKAQREFIDETAAYKSKKESDKRAKELKAELDDKKDQIVKNDKWLAQQAIKFEEDIAGARAKATVGSIEAQRFEVKERIKELTRLAAARKDLDGEKAKKFVADGEAAFLKELEIKNAAEAKQTIIDIERETADLKLSISKDSFSKDMALLDMEMEKRKEQYQLNIDFLNEKKALGDKLSANELAQLKQSERAVAALSELQLAKIEEVKQANKSSFEDMLDDMSDVTGKMDGMAANFVDGFTDSIADFAIHGKQTFGDFAMSVIDDIGRMIIKAEAANLINALLGRETGNSAGGLFENLLGAGSAATKGSAKKQPIAKSGGLGDSSGGGVIEWISSVLPASAVGGGAGDDTSILQSINQTLQSILSSMSLGGSLVPGQSSGIGNAVGGALGIGQSLYQEITGGNEGASIEEQKAMSQELFDFQVAGQNRVRDNSDEAWGQMTNKVSDSTNEMSAGSDALTETVASGFAAMASSGISSMASLLKSVLAAIAKMIVQYLVLAAVKALAGFASGGTTGGSGGNSAGLSSSMGSFNSDAASGVNASAYKKGGVASFTAFANGGAMNMASQLSNAPFMTESDMLKGGVKKSPHVALFAEASVPEAFIPMQDGKNVPLSLSEDRDGNVTGLIPLPSGEMLTTRLVGPTNVGSAAQSPTESAKAFANGGVTIGSGGSKVPSPSSLVSSGEAQIININISDENTAASLESIASSINELPKFEKSFNNSNDNITNSASTGDVSISITVNEDGSSSKKGTGDDGSGWDEVADRVKVMVTKELAEQRRPGGSLR